MSWRKFAVLVRGLPTDSRTVTLQIDRERDKPKPKRLGEVKVEEPIPTPREGQTERLLRDVLDALRFLTWAVIAVQAGKKAPPAPKPAPRPTDPRPMAGSAKRQLFEQWNERVKIASN